MMDFLLKLAQLSQALLTPVIGAVVAYVAWQQWKASREKLRREERDRRLARFDRRLAIYRAVVKYLRAVTAEWQPTNDHVTEFIEATADATFLFGPEVDEYLETLWHKGIDLKVSNLDAPSGVWSEVPLEGGIL